ncbi:c-type cytochrome, partial [bacterium]|nr:c-type cytochrome [bacterium]
HDLMPHNLVITLPEALKEVAQLGLQVGPNNGWQGLPYVPESDKVLHATSMVPADQQATLTFTAPTTAGEYPYVCTFPQHWYRMYGVMVVVNDLDDWQKKPVEPANPIGSNRSFVQAWKVSDLKDELESGIRGRSPEIGKRLFVEASCAGCHKMQGEGGAIGPELTDVYARWKGDRVGILREVLEPSHKVDAKYVMQRILTVDGHTVTGVLLSEDDDKVVLLSNPEAKEPTVILQDDIEAMVPSSVSMMPKALMDQYTKDEVFEVLAYLESVASKPSP